MLKTGDYSSEDMNDVLCLEPKDVGDLAACRVRYLPRFLVACKQVASFRWKALPIEPMLRDIKADFPDGFMLSQVHPHAGTGTLDAIDAKW